MNNCQECGENHISYWCLDKVCEKRLLCDQCCWRHGETQEIKITNDKNIIPLNEIKKWIMGVYQSLIQIMEKIMKFSQSTRKTFEQQLSDFNRIDLLTQQYELYCHYKQFRTTFDSTIFNMNEIMNAWDFQYTNYEEQPQEYKDNFKDCQNSLSERNFNKAEQQFLSVCPEDSKYFKIESLILQKRYSEALELSDQIIKCIEIKSLQEHKEAIKNLYPKLLLQKAKIYHKLEKYLEALQVLKEVRNYKEYMSHEKLKIDLQMAKTYMKCGQFDCGFKQLKDMDNHVPYKELLHSDEDKPFYNQFSFRLAYAKARLLSLELGSFQIETLNQINFDQDGYEEVIKKEIVQIESLYKEVLQKEPTNQKALYGLSQVYLKQYNYQKAREILYQLYQLNPKYRKAEFSLIFVKNKLHNLNIDRVDQSRYIQCFQRFSEYF